jgi:hypothetical protein
LKTRLPYKEIDFDWYLFNGFLHIDNFVVELFFPAKMLEMSGERAGESEEIGIGTRVHTG